MGNKQGSLSNHLETASKTGALAFPGKVRKFGFLDFRFIYLKFFSDSEMDKIQDL